MRVRGRRDRSTEGRRPSVRTAAPATVLRRRRLPCVVVAVAIAVAVAVMFDVVSKVEAIGTNVTIPLGYRIVGRTVETEGTFVREFEGIPFAEPPVGERRFRPAEPKRGPETEANATYEALTGPPKCFTTAGSEDCLYLNVWAPTVDNDDGDEREPFPVMVYIHGGGFYLGSIDDRRWDGANFAASGVVLVTMQYRLHWLGNMDLRPIFGYDKIPKDQIPNLGLEDQREALRWVQQNIRAFGGDPDKVTIFGHSSGASCVMSHMASRRSEPLFRRAIVQSGSHVNSKTMGMTLSIAMRFMLLYIERQIRCADSIFGFYPCLVLGGWPRPDMDWWRSNSVDTDVLATVFTTSREIGFTRGLGVVATGPGYDVEDNPPLEMKRGVGGDKDLIMGIVMDEALTLFPTYATYPGLDGDQEDCGGGLDPNLVWCRPTLTTVDLVKEDPTGSDRPGRRAAWSDERAVFGIIAELVFGIPARSMLDHHRGEHTYSYVVDLPGLRTTACRGNGTDHGYEHDSIWGRDRGRLPQMHETWTRFARTGDPGNITVGNVTVQWRPYDANGANDDNRYTVILSDESLRSRNDPFGTERTTLQDLLLYECAWFTPVGALLLRPVCTYNPVYSFALDFLPIRSGAGIVGADSGLRERYERGKAFFHKKIRAYLSA